MAKKSKYEGYTNQQWIAEFIRVYNKGGVNALVTLYRKLCFGSVHEMWNPSFISDLMYRAMEQYKDMQIESIEKVYKSDTDTFSKSRHNKNYHPVTEIEKQAKQRNCGQCTVCPLAVYNELGQVRGCKYQGDDYQQEKDANDYVTSQACRQACLDAMATV